MEINRSAPQVEVRPQGRFPPRLGALLLLPPIDPTGPSLDRRIAAAAAGLKGIKSYVLYSVMLLTLVFAAAVGRRALQMRRDRNATID